MSRILLIDDSADYRQRLIRKINKLYDDVDVDEYDPVSRGFLSDDVAWQTYALIILDYDLGVGRENGLDWMLRFGAIPAMPPVIMLTTEDDTELAVRVLKAGAIDFIDKSDLNEETIKTILDDVFALAGKQNTLIANRENTEKNVADSIKNAPLPDLLFQNEEENTATIVDCSDENFITTDAQLKKFGFIVPGYRLLKEIGRGGMSTVLLAKSDEEENEVVLKVMFTESRKKLLALKRFMQEYTLISYLDHPHVVKIYERAFSADFAYIAMEYFPSGDLTQKLTGKLELETVNEYIRQICSGLVAIHDLHIVHRDIKPGNILLRKDGTLAITDFGVAKNLTSDVEDKAINEHIVGTPYYMSPEHGSGMSFDHRSDLYSLGIMIYQMLTGERPYIAGSVAQLILMHLNAPIPRLPGGVAKYQPLIDGLLAKDPDERFQSANDVILGLDWIK